MTDPTISFGVWVRKALRRRSLAIMTTIAPQTRTDLLWARDARRRLGEEQESPSLALLASGQLFGAAAEPLASPPRQTPEAIWSLSATPESVVRLCECDAENRFIFHVANQAQNGITVFAAKTLPGLQHGFVHLYGKTDDFGGLPIGTPPAHVKAEVFVIGNSPDHLPVLDSMIKGRRARSESATRTVLYLHDASLKYLLELYYGSEYRVMVRNEYGSGVDRVESATARLLNGMSGVRLLARAGGVDTIICHGAGTARLIQDECEFLETPPSVKVLEHPVFPGMAERVDACCADRERVDELLVRCSVDGEIFVGSFGIPYDWKNPWQLMEVCRDLQSGGDIDGLVIAGWGAQAVLSRQSVTAVRGVHIYSQACEGCLLALMQAVRVAVQLRMIIGGEASGVLAQLSSVRTATIASRSINDSPLAHVEYLPVGITDRDLRHRIALSLQIPQDESRTTLEERTSLSDYLDEFLALLNHEVLAR